MVVADLLGIVTRGAQLRIEENVARIEAGGKAQQLREMDIVLSDCAVDLAIILNETGDIPASLLVLAISRRFYDLSNED